MTDINLISFFFFLKQSFRIENDLHPSPVGSEMTHETNVETTDGRGNRVGSG